jgi:hypothetical protein
MKLTMATTNGVEVLGLSGYFFIYDAEAVSDVTAAVNNELLNTMADKIDPSIIEAATQAANSISSIS